MYDAVAYCRLFLWHIVLECEHAGSIGGHFWSVLNSAESFVNLIWY